MKNLVSSVLLTATTVAETSEATTLYNPLLDENGQFVDASEAVNNIGNLWEEWDIVNKILTALPSIVIAVILVVLGFVLAKLASKIIVKTFSANHVDPSVYNFIRRFVSAGIKLIFILFAVSMFYDVNSIFVALGGAGLAAGIGLQDSVAQFASGIQILINHPFKTGDFVEVNGVSGSVTDIRFMNTVINTPDNKKIIIPNSHITTNHIINYSAENSRRVDLMFSISYKDDIQMAKNVILDVIRDNDKILTDPAPEVYVNSHEASSVCLVARIWCAGIDYWNVYFSMQENVKIAFDKNGISIPYNQVDVHIVNK
ncbi:MAG: mechanosensitive ion channel [Ruminococcaceae bacterium]|nr:mechanosensitive ion channel [Oscillospiraceae bacterium]